MKILIMSDSHRKDGNVLEAIQANPDIDGLIHLGDSEGSEDLIAEALGEERNLYIVAGNNDFFSSLKSEIEMKLGKHRVFLCHGHQYNVNLGVEMLCKEAKARGCDVAMYGHTHRPFLEVIDGITILNPGSISYPRQIGREQTYLIATLNPDGFLEFQKKVIN